MRLIIGLGNPGKKYAHTRHNAGFMALDALALNCKVSWKKDTGKVALIAQCAMGNTGVILAKPLTYMNASGSSAQKLAHYYKVEHADMLIIYDDIDLLLGDARLRTEGSSGGQNGMQSVIDAFGTSEIPRLRIGVAEEKTGKQDVPAEEYVLCPFSKNGAEKIAIVVDGLIKEIKRWASA